MKVNQEITRLAWPAIVSNITTPLLGLVDTAITGHMGDAAYVGAIAVGGTMFSLTYWALNFLRMGTSSLTSQAYGRGGAETYVWLQRSISLAMIIALALIICREYIANALLYFLDPDPTTHTLTRAYYDILIFGAPMVLGTYSLSGWFLGMQDSKAPMWMAIVTNVANIVISFLLVYPFGMGIQGVAWGTLWGQAIGFLLGLGIAQRQYGIVKRLRSRQVRELARTTPKSSFFTTNIDIFLRTLCLAAVTLWFTRAGAAQSTDVLAANAVLMQLFILFSYFMDGFAFAGEALSGKYFGACDWPQLKATIRGIFRWGIYVASTFTVAYLFGGKWILMLLSDTPSIVDTAMHYRWWIVGVPFAGVAAFVWDGIFIGMGLTRQMLLSMACAAAMFFGIYLLCIGPWGNHGLWLAFIGYLLTRGLIQTGLYARQRSSH